MRYHTLGGIAASALICTMSVPKFCKITASFGVFLETHKHQNLTRLSLTIDSLIGRSIDLQVYHVTLFILN